MTETIEHIGFSDRPKLLQAMSERRVVIMLDVDGHSRRMTIEPGALPLDEQTLGKEVSLLLVQLARHVLDAEGKLDWENVIGKSGAKQ